MQEGDVESTGIGGGCVPIWLVFFTYRGILDSFSGFMYRSDDTSPGDGDFAGEFYETERLRKNWFWAAAH